ncbi:hypothetical protein RJT34_12062 [Clitoria ternatea]|uniref:Uncharacterized protein n=1 Tax=Clitoria ternatea TaxID=43366 RepID=A0AAN9JN69_CLITE
MDTKANLVAARQGGILRARESKIKSEKEREVKKETDKGTKVAAALGVGVREEEERAGEGGETRTAVAHGSVGLSDGVRGSTGVCGGGGQRWWRRGMRGTGAGELGSNLRFEGTDRSQIWWLARQRGHDE